MKFRLIKQNEIGLAVNIIQENYSKKYRKAAFKEMEAMFKNYTARPKYIVAEEKGEIIGLGGYIQSWMDYNIYQIFWINIKPGFQNKGIGTKLIERIIRILKNKKASMILLTTSKPRFYSKKFNFKTLAKFKNKKYDLMCLKLN